MSDLYTLNALNETDPTKTYTLPLFVKLGRQADIISYTDLSFRETHDGISYVIKNITEDYMYELKLMALTIILSDDEYEKYKYKPKILAYDLYGSPELYFIILLLNDMASVREFDTKTLKLLTKQNLNIALSSIYKGEKNSLIEYNRNH